ncbi:unnamed protein product [Gordionus sp. m RMFG-2023]
MRGRVGKITDKGTIMIRHIPIINFPPILNRIKEVFNKNNVVKAVNEKKNRNETETFTENEEMMNFSLWGIQKFDHISDEMEPAKHTLLDLKAIEYSKSKLVGHIVYFQILELYGNLEGENIGNATMKNLLTYHPCLIYYYNYSPFKNKSFNRALLRRGLCKCNDNQISKYKKTTTKSIIPILRSKFDKFYSDYEQNPIINRYNYYKTILFSPDKLNFEEKLAVSFYSAQGKAQKARLGYWKSFVTSGDQKSKWLFKIGHYMKKLVSF